VVKVNRGEENKGHKKEKGKETSTNAGKTIFSPCVDWGGRGRNKNWEPKGKKANPRVRQLWKRVGLFKKAVFRKGTRESKISGKRDHQTRYSSEKRKTLTKRYCPENARETEVESGLDKGPQAEGNRAARKSRESRRVLQEKKKS